MHIIQNTIDKKVSKPVMMHAMISSINKHGNPINLPGDILEMICGDGFLGKKQNLTE